MGCDRVEDKDWKTGDIKCFSHQWLHISPGLPLDLSKTEEKVLMFFFVVVLFFLHLNPMTKQLIV